MTLREKYIEGAMKDRIGDCYRMAGRYVMDNDNAILVHGTINGIRFTGKDVDNPHAWVEEGNEVFDPVWDQRFPKEAYYEIAGAKPIKSYNLDQAAAEMLKSEHWGPW